MHAWAAEIAQSIADTRQGDLTGRLSARPSEEDASFVLELDADHRLLATIVPEACARAPAWVIAVTTSDADTPAPATGGRRRRNANWTRAQFEDVVLALVAQYERSRAQGPG